MTWFIRQTVSCITPLPLNMVGPHRVHLLCPLPLWNEIRFQGPQSRYYSIRFHIKKLKTICHHGRSKIMSGFLTHDCDYTETIYCRLLLRMARRKID